MNIAVVGATGMVGQNFLALLSRRAFPYSQIRLFGSEKSQGKSLSFRSQNLVLELLSDKTPLKGVDMAFFSAGESISREWAPRFAEEGAVVIDNSSAFRMKEGVPLIVPEVNGKKIIKKGIIANPNCSTIQLVMALNPLKKHFGLKSVHVSSYQAVSGAGRRAVEQLIKESKALLDQSDQWLSRGPAKPEAQKNAEQPAPSFASLPAESQSLTFNCMPQIGTLNHAGFSTEEWKLMQESKKILNLPHLKVTATAVRVPVFNGHGEAVLLTLAQPAGKEEVKTVLARQKGLQLLEGDSLPHQRFVDGKEDVYVGRLRPVPEPAPGSESEPAPGSEPASGSEPAPGSEQNQSPARFRHWMMWIAGDNLKKGAALNALQIAETLIQ